MSKYQQIVDALERIDQINYITTGGWPGKDETEVKK